MARSVRRRLRRATARALAGVVLLGLAACDGQGPQRPELDPEPDPGTSAAPAVELTLGYWGSRAEVETMRKLVGVYNASSETTNVSVVTWPDRETAVRELRATEDFPDVYLASRRDLSWLREEGHTRPVDELLDERFVDFGDGYSREALDAFSADQRLQCMPFGVEPQVMFYNTDLVDFERMARRGLDVPTSPSSFTFDELRAAAEFATKPRRGTRGLYVEPSLEGLAPFIYSGGGSVFDDEETPTSLAFSSDETRDALERTLELLRNAAVTLGPEQLEEAPAREWFASGRLGMMPGYRSWVPELRGVEGLEFDVLPMPTLDQRATVGDLTGLCLSPDAESTSYAADLLVHLSSEEVVRPLTRTGYLVPANQQVALSEDFLQPGREPETAGVFTYVVRFMRTPPLVEDWTRLLAAVDAEVERLVEAPGVLDLEAVTEEIDEESRQVLAPELIEPSEQADTDDEG